MKRLLLTSIFRPFSVPNRFNLPGDEKFLDYFSNRLTREPGLFALHDNHPTVAPHLVGSNLQANVTVMDFPSIEEFRHELAKGYDVLGISYLTLHLPKLIHMIAVAQKIAPQTKIVIGGFGTALHDLEKLEVDGICRGDGVRFMREMLGERPDRPIDHPMLTVDIGLRIGVQQPDLGTHKVGIIVNGFGCPHACEFCATSAYFGKRHVPFVPDGKSLYELMAHYDERLGVRDFIIYEEDFFLYRKDIDQYLSVFQNRPAPYSFACYSTVKAISKYSIEALARAGLSHVWVGVESVDSPYNKSNGRPIAELFDELQHYGITTTGSIIAGLDYHTEKNLPKEFEHLTSLFPSTVQISNLIASPRTELRTRLEREGRLLPDVDIRDSNLYSEMVAHPEFGRGELRKWILEGYDFVYRTIGPALYRMLHTWFRGWSNLHPECDPLLRMRAAILAERVRGLAPVFLETADYLPNDDIRVKVAVLLEEIERRLGAWTDTEKSAAASIKKAFDREKERLSHSGPHVYEPKTRVSYYGPDADAGLFHAQSPTPVSTPAPWAYA